MRADRWLSLSLMFVVPLAACSHPASPPTAAGPAGIVATAGPTAGNAPPAGPAATASATSTLPAGPSAIRTAGPAGNHPTAGPQTCAESQLRASIDPFQIPGNGMRDSVGRRLYGVLLDFQNTSPTACILNGYPGAAILDQTRHQVRQAARTLHGELLGLPATQNVGAPVTLAPHAYAYAGLEGADERDPGTVQADCAAPDYPQILVTPPNTSIAVPFTVSWPRCYSFQVHPVRARPARPSLG